ncbi:MAG TPA: lipid-binding SYLF domain-containing protein [Steroidobacteraceae bacterium]|nr:lipid-binding SYLF domain-containing protein [Steroidobacteraceae bacterium]
MKRRSLVAISLFVAAALSGAAFAQSDESSSSTSESAAPQHHHMSRRATYGPEILVDDAVLAVGKMKRDAHAAQLLQRARGILVIPHYVEAAALVGGAGGTGVLLLQHDGQWSNPAFYRVGGASIGLQAGGAAGPVCLLLMNEKAVDAFEMHKSRWSLNGNAGLTVVKYSAEGERGIGEGDVVLWSGTEGVFGGAAIAVNDIRRDEKADERYYGQKVSTDQILSGNINNPHEDNAKLLRDVMPLRVASK